MEENQLAEYLHNQQNQILTLQILLQSLVDELVENEIIKEESLNKKVSKKVYLIKKELEALKTQTQFNVPFNFGGPIAEA
jgi:hypothetical protein